MSPNKTPGSEGIIKTGKSANREDQSLQIPFHFIHSFHQIFRFEFPEFSYVEWNSIFRQNGPISSIQAWAHIIHQELLDKMLKDCDEVAVT